VEEELFTLNPFFGKAGSQELFQGLILINLIGAKAFGFAKRFLCIYQ
jgi:hypothetical protein